LLIHLFSKVDTYFVNPSVSANVLAGLKLGMCFVFVTFTGMEGHVDTGLIMCSRLGGHIYVSNLVLLSAVSLSLLIQLSTAV
jgi:hypothetical protein